MTPAPCTHPDYLPEIFLPFVWSNFEDWRYDYWQDHYHYDDYPSVAAQPAAGAETPDTIDERAKEAPSYS